MSIGDVFMIFGVLLSLGIVLPGMLLALFLILPRPVETAREKLQVSPWKCLGTGLLVLVVAVIVLSILLRMPNALLQLLGWAGLSGLLGYTSLGAAGLSTLMGQRWQRFSPNLSRPSALLRGAIALELAAIFPVLGWFLVIPLVTIFSIGAITLALLRPNRKLAAPVSRNEVPNVLKAS